MKLESRLMLGNVTLTKDKGYSILHRSGSEESSLSVGRLESIHNNKLVLDVSCRFNSIVLEINCEMIISIAEVEL